MSGPVPRHLRNPRRAYDHDGTEIPPATVGGSRAQGDTTVSIYCNACHHGIVASTDNMRGDLAIPDIPVALRLRCSRCGSDNIGVMTDITAHYDRDRIMRGMASALPDSYRVVRLPIEKGAPAEARAPEPNVR